ncbi:MAG: aminotransferase class III-fold pyridoxal phosphate-dependent enzyme [Gemmatimonadales bacterium]|nr:aminotransferase class III-fold pyridoxal phosphate-dependent enzyme [Gemmatimonadales bacterium]MBA3555275.1 aminotransferase class III-fold pyridoxal phosphate-dependent enzyme [Gemmatimonadales bacterium]MDQ3428244.1 aminotransferase class III-fold pyridoxal phosphate-dependent enzyme [Gemmatimonadota bacterium]
MLKAEAPALLPVYAQMPVRPSRGRGSWLIDEDGREWLDAYGGHAVATTGHSHPDVVRAVAEQAEALLFYSTAVPHPLREELAETLAALCPQPLGRIFFCNSGAEANENALHLARRHTGRGTIVSLRGGWHGRTAATLACTDGAPYEAAARRAGVPLSRKVAFDDVAALEKAVDDSVAAVIVEPVQGFAGARDCSPNFLRSAREICDARGAALLFDEVQCGIGRCGAFSAAESFGVTPDLLTFAKGLAAGLPIGAVVATPALVESLAPGDLGSTFGGGPVPCAAALANIAVIERDDLIGNAVRMGEYLTEGARKLGVTRVSGRGLLLGLHLERPAVEVQHALFSHQILTGTATDPRVLRLLPPLSFSSRECDLLLAGLQEVLR